MSDAIINDMHINLSDGMTSLNNLNDIAWAEIARALCLILGIAPAAMLGV